MYMHFMSYCKTNHQLTKEGKRFFFTQSEFEHLVHLMVDLDIC